jgi:tetratricopeptide (TPR) repeat protein
VKPQAIALALAVLAAAVVARAQSPDYQECLRLYRLGQVEAGFKCAAAMGPAETARDMEDVIARADKSGKIGELEASVLLQAELLFADGVNDQFLPTLKIARRQQVISHLHAALRSLAPKTDFMRAWYLLWEAFLQGFSYPFSEAPDYFSAAMRTFPNDAEMQLAAGAGREVRWWSATDNPRRNPNPSPGSTETVMRLAAGDFRRSIAADPQLVEGHLRLGRVLMLTGELDEAEAQLKYVQSAQDDVIRYLGFLFTGELREQRKDTAGAAQAYEAASRVMPLAQSAPLAAARLAHASGQRPEAAALIAKMLTGQEKSEDPWWWYVRGQWWRYKNYLERARRLVRQ